MTLRTLNYGKYGVCLIMGNARYLSSTVVRASILHIKDPRNPKPQTLFETKELLLATPVKALPDSLCSSRPENL